MRQKDVDLNCPSCHHPDLGVNDFYWCKETPTPCKNHGGLCKKCVSKNKAAKKQEKEDYAKEFFVA